MKVAKKSKKPRCPKCLIGGYTQGTAPDGRPRFTCTHCDNTWTNGKDGYPYAGHAES